LERRTKKGGGGGEKKKGTLERGKKEKDKTPS